MSMRPYKVITSNRLLSNLVGTQPSRSHIARGVVSCHVHHKHSRDLRKLHTQPSIAKSRKPSSITNHIPRRHSSALSSCISAPRAAFSTASSATTKMAPSVLGLGIPHSSPMVPAERAEGLRKVLEAMDEDMKASPYDWDMFYVEADMDFELVLQKLREKEWDVVMVGMGLRTGSQLTVFFEKIVNAVHRELPKTKIAFNASIDATQEACRRALEL